PAGGPVPDENGLTYWTCNISACPYPYNYDFCGGTVGVNDNNPCTDGKRIDVSRAFWVSKFGSWFNANGLTNFNPSPYGTTQNEAFLDRAYSFYLRKTPPHSDPNHDNWDAGFRFW